MTVEQSDLYHVTERDKSFHGGHEPPKHENFNGICENRSTTDILLFLLIIAMWIAMTVVGARAVQSGNPYRLLAPMDPSGDMCGYTDNKVDLPEFYTITTFGIGICIEECPTTTANFSSTNPNDYYCLPEAPTESTAKQAYIIAACHTDGIFTPTLACICNIKAAAEPYFHRCVFDDDNFRNNFANQGISNDYLQNFIADILAVREIIFGVGFALAIVLSFLWVVLMRGVIVSHIIVWGSLLSILGMLIILVILSYTTADAWSNQDPQQHSDNEILSLQVASVVFAVIGFLYFCLMLFLFSRIELAISIIAQAAKSITAMPLMVFTPVINTTALILFMIPWMFYMIFLASDGEITKQSYEIDYNGVTQTVYYNTLTYSQTAQQNLWFMFFCYLWTNNFIQACGMIIIAIAVSNWYFTSDEKKDEIGSSTVIRAYWLTVRYHMGTAAFGSLLIAIVEFIRAVVIYIEKKLKASQYGQCFLTYVCCCIHCCLWCIECCLKFISRNAYIQTAIHGTSFCTSCKEAFFILARNILRIGALHVVSSVLLFLGRVFVVVGSSTIVYYILTGSYTNEVHGLIGPMVVVIFLSYFTAAMFMDIFQMSADTIIMCFITDEEIHEGQAKYGNKELNGFIAEKGALKDDDLKAHHAATANRHGQSGEEDKYVSAKPN